MMTEHRTSLPLLLVAILIGLFLVLPVAIVIPMSFSPTDFLEFPPRGFSTRWYQTFFTDEKWYGSALTSLQVAVLTVLVTSVLGTMCALGLVRGNFPGKKLLGALIIGPIVVPVVLISIGMYFVFVRWQIVGSLIGLVIAHSVLALPLVIITVSASLKNFDRSVELAASVCGANAWRVFAHVTLPAIMPGVVSGALFAFVISWDEVVTSIFLSSPYNRTLPVVVWTQIKTQVDPTIAAVSTLLVLASTAVMALTVYLGSRRPKESSEK